MKNYYRLSAPFILASASPVRHKMLLNVKIPHKVIHSSIDEEQEKIHISHFPIPEQAKKLSLLKGQEVSAKYPKALVLSADQIGEFRNQPLFKPGSPEENIKILTQMSGSIHQQHTAASLFYQGKLVQNFFESVSLTMRSLTAAEIQTYVEFAKPWNCCGGYRFEQLGKHLFSFIKGSEDSILGLPILQILNFLHERHYLSIVV